MKARSLAIVIAVAAAASLSGCSSLLGTIDWTGHSIKEVIAKLGPATRISSYPFGGSVYVWENHLTRTEAPDVTSFEGAPHLMSVIEREVFVVNDQGIVTAKKTQTIADPATSGGTPATAGGFGQP